EPHFSMLWSSRIPRVTFGEVGQPSAEVTIIAGELGGRHAPAPPPHSWAARAESDAAIWTVRMQPGARWEMPPARAADTVRSLYFFRGEGLMIGGEPIPASSAVVLASDRALRFEARGTEVDALLLQARP